MSEEEEISFFIEWRKHWLFLFAKGKGRTRETQVPQYLAACSARVIDSFSTFPVEKRQPEKMTTYVSSPGDGPVIEEGDFGPRT